MRYRGYDIEHVGTWRMRYARYVVFHSTGEFEVARSSKMKDARAFVDDAVVFADVMPAGDNQYLMDYRGFYLTQESPPFDMIAAWFYGIAQGPHSVSDTVAEAQLKIDDYIRTLRGKAREDQELSWVLKMSLPPAQLVRSRTV